MTSREEAERIVRKWVLRVYGTPIDAMEGDFFSLINAISQALEQRDETAAHYEMEAFSARRKLEEADSLIRRLVEVLEDPGCSCSKGEDSGEPEDHFTLCMYRRSHQALSDSSLAEYRKEKP